MEVAKLTNPGFDYTPEQMKLITDTVAKNATADELKLFLYRAKHLGLDPLTPGQIYFIKYGNNPGTIVVGLDGFRVRAARTSKHSGTKRGVLRDAQGKCTGGWAEVYRSDWSQPAREEVSLKEYSTGKGNWLSKPETMIKKVAEVAALRMAFPDELGGSYSPEEMEQAEVRLEVLPTLATLKNSIHDLNEDPSYARATGPLAKITSAQRAEIHQGAGLAGIASERLKDWLKDNFGNPTTDINLLQYNRLMAWINMEMDKQVAAEKLSVAEAVKVGDSLDDQGRID